MASLISHPCSPHMGEALAAQLATSVTHSLSLTRFILKGDSLVVIQALNSSSSVQDWRISPVIMSSLNNIHSDSLWEARKINRSANFCAHSVARWVVALAAFPFPPLPLLSTGLISIYLLCSFF